jgi:(1->4)-alpha-D-glucan 1-alpha-D-glucosylmutase
VSGPASAKGVEDTALYLYVPLVSRNEVGGAPNRPLDDAVERFHAGNLRRAERWPVGLVTTNTHDAKRSGDIRSRLAVLSECRRSGSVPCIVGAD